MVNHSYGSGAVPAEEALRKAVGVAPEVQSCTTVNKQVSAYHWNIPWVSDYELEGAEEVILALHTGGSRKVRTLMPDGWSRKVSVPGLLHVIPAKTATAFKIDGHLEFTSLHFAHSQIETLGGAGLARSMPIPFRFSFTDPFTTSCIAVLCEELRSPRECGSLFVDHLTDALWLHILRSSATSSGPTTRREAIASKALGRVLEMISASIETGISLDQLAEAAGLTRFHFARAFRDAMGEPPHSYLTHCRIEHAKELLRHTDDPLAEIALSAGFSSQSHFSTVFRKRVGQTPRKFRLQGEFPIRKPTSANGTPRSSHNS